MHHFDSACFMHSCAFARGAQFQAYRWPGALSEIILVLHSIGGFCHPRMGGISIVPFPYISLLVFTTRLPSMDGVVVGILVCCSFVSEFILRSSPSHSIALPPNEQTSSLTLFRGLQRQRISSKVLEKLNGERSSNL